MQTEILRLALGVNSPTTPATALFDGEFCAFLDVRGDERYFTGHFPGYPIMPGVLLVEAMAQSVKLMAADRFAPDAEVYLVGVGKTRFFRPVLPPARLRFAARLQTVLDAPENKIVAVCTAFVEGTRVAKAEIVLSHP